MFVYKIGFLAIAVGFSQLSACSLATNNPNVVELKQKKTPAIAVQSDNREKTSEFQVEGDVLDFPLCSALTPSCGEVIEIAQLSLLEDPSLSELQKNPSSYLIEVRHSSKNYYVLFSPKTPADDPSQEGSRRTELAADMYYVIRKNDKKVIARKFFR